MGDVPVPDGRSTRRAPSRAPSRAPARAAVPPSRADRRRAARIRRNRVVLVIATGASAGILAAWFPVSSLLHQHSELAAASSQLNRLDQQNASLRRREKEMRTPANLGRIAQQQYDLVPPGEEAYQVLPPSRTAGTSGAPSTSGTLGVGSSAGTGTRTGAASRAAERPSPSSAAGASGGSSGNFFVRVLRTLEFWR